MFQSWQSVKITGEDLEAHGRTGTVRSAGVYQGEGDKKGEVVDLVDVQLDGDTEPTTFQADQVEALT